MAKPLRSAHTFASTHSIGLNVSPVRLPPINADSLLGVLRQAHREFVFELLDAASSAALGEFVKRDKAKMLVACMGLIEQLIKWEHKRLSKSRRRRGAPRKR